MRWLAVTVAFACGGTARPTIPPPSTIPLDDVTVRLDQQIVPSSPAWLANVRLEHIRDYDVYEPATASASTPIAILIHDAGGHRRELGPLAQHLARHGVRAIVPAVDHDHPSDYGASDGIRVHWEHATPEPSKKHRPPIVLVGHGAGAYLAARMSIADDPTFIGSVALAPATPPRYDGRSRLYAGDESKRLVQLDVERPTGRCAAGAIELASRMTRNTRTRARLAGTSYCGVLGEPSCAARCGGTHESTSTAAFEAVARVVAAWTSSSTVAETDLLAATPMTKDIESKHAWVNTDDWAMPGLFWELGGAARDDTLRTTRGAIGVRLDYHAWPNWDSPRLPSFTRRPAFYSPRRWGLGGYGEIAWQHDELERDDLRLGAGFVFARARGKSHVALGLGANVLLGQHGVAVGADATLHIGPFFAFRVGTTREDQIAIHGSIMVTVPASVVAILVPFAM